VRQRFHPDKHTLQLMESFRQMTNTCIQIGSENNASSMKRPSLLSYSELGGFHLPSAYKLCAISKAAGILARYRKLSKRHHVKQPYCTRPTLTTCYGLKQLPGTLRLPGGFEVPLNGYTERLLAQPGVEVRSITLTQRSLSISVRKQTQPTACMGIMGIDRNLDNVTLADTDNQVQRHDLSKASMVKAGCREVRSHFSRNDLKIGRGIYKKYGRLEKNRVAWLLHNVSANIVLQARLKRQAIVMEDLRGIRRLYRKGNGQGPCYRARMNDWSFAEVQRQIQYKAEWNGIPVIYVRAFGTSAKCSICGHRALPEENRQLHCPSCGLTIDRDVNAARNILARGLRFKPVGSVNEAMVQELQRRVILKVDADQSTSKPITNEPRS